MASKGGSPPPRKGYQEVADLICNRIQNGTYPARHLLPTERQLVEEFKVSRTTIRRALQTIIEAGWAEQSPNRGVIARIGPKKETTKNIGFIDHHDTLNHILFLALNKNLQTLGYHLVHLDSRVYGVEGAIQYAEENNFAATVIWPKKGHVDLSIVDPIIKRFPVINVQHEFANLPNNLVTEDHFQGGWLAAKQFIDNGYKRIAITGMLDMLRTNHDRFSGCVMGQFDNGITPEASDYVFCYTSDMPGPDLRNLARRLQDQDRPDAIFILDDYLVPFVADTIKEANLQVPQDIAVIAFGNDVPYHFGEVGLTTISIEWEEVANALGKMIMQKISGHPKTPHRIAIPVDLICRGSCGAPQSKWSKRPYYSHVNNLTYATPEDRAPKHPNTQNDHQYIFSNRTTNSKDGTKQ